MNFTSVGLEIQLNKPYEEALESIESALKEEGFGVLTFIDVKATFLEKLDINFRPYAIIGACNPPLAHRALSTDAEVGLMLPCNVTVESDGPQKSIVRIANPEMLLKLGLRKENSELHIVASEAKKKLERAAKVIAEE